MQRFETKYDLLNAIYKDRNLKKGVVALFQYLIQKSDKQSCFPAVDTIAAELNVCKRTVQNNMRKLEQAGYIIRKERWYNHQQLTNEYFFNFGITDDEVEEKKLTQKEYEAITACSNDNIGEPINKVNVIRNIKGMKLEARQQMLLTYMCYRANKNGVIYDTPQAMMNGVGLCWRTFRKWISSLIRCGLIQLTQVCVSGIEYFIITLSNVLRTGNVECADVMISDDNSDMDMVCVSEPACISPVVERKLSGLGMKLKGWISHIGSKICAEWKKLRKILRI